MLRGQVGSLEIEWRNTKDIVSKSYQRMEKANSRAERRLEDGEGDNGPVAPKSEGSAESLPLVGFAKKLQEMKGA